MRRRALCAASAVSGGNELPAIPDGFFPLYLTYDYFEREGKVIVSYIINPSTTTIELWNIVYSYAKVVGEYDGFSYDFYTEEYGIDLYIGGYKITYCYAYDDGYVEIFADSHFFYGTLFSTGKIIYTE